MAPLMMGVITEDRISLNMSHPLYHSSLRTFLLYAFHPLFMHL